MNYLWRALGGLTNPKLLQTLKCLFINRVFTSENDIENGLDNQANRVGGGLRTIEAEDCLAAAERFAVSCTDTDLAQMAEMLTGLK